MRETICLCNERRPSASSQGALQLKYDFRGKPDYEYVQLTTALEIPQAGYAFGFWMDDGGVGFPARLRIVDSTGETHQVELYSAQQQGWQFVAGSLDGPTTCWGGDGNRRRDCRQCTLYNPRRHHFLSDR